MLRGCDRLGLLDDDHGFTVDLLRRAFLSFDDYIGRRIGRVARLPLSGVAIVGHL